MKTLIMKRQGGKTIIDTATATKKEAKQILSDKYKNLLQGSYDSLTEHDGLFLKGTELRIADVTYFLEQDKTL